MLKLEKIGNIAVKVTPHRTLNHSRGVISESEFQRDLEEDLLDCLKDQKVIAVRRITIKRNNQNFPTKHLILTFNTPVLPKSVKIAYINCPVRHFIPNPLRCFKCQRFGHTITACRGKQICARCSLPDHDPLRGTSSLGVTGFTTPRYPSVCSPFEFLPFFSFCFFFLPSRVGEGALHEKLLPLCLLSASHGQQYTPTCLPCVATL
ncbi:hypothetical protein AVEN_81978-1 [Araneus ventricosus]|uniref:CCHC-type domain-containing protein n=1 Tax=Araneus ventricosus TaxID=182803 RepID=A0A4Y2R1Z7_ARAVE|nr:hypothetical protein AVEN_81978-1 [Araneus ventricosus]